MHEWWCTHPGRSETAPCLHHSFVQQHKAVCGEGERASESCLRLEEEHEMYIRPDRHREDSVRIPAKLINKL